MEYKLRKAEPKDVPDILRLVKVCRSTSKNDRKWARARALLAGFETWRRRKKKLTIKGKNVRHLMVWREEV